MVGVIYIQEITINECLRNRNTKTKTKNCQGINDINYLQENNKTVIRRKRIVNGKVMPTNGFYCLDFSNKTKQRIK